MSIPAKGGNGQKTTPAVFNTIGVLFLRSSWKWRSLCLIGNRILYNTISC